jgi:HSP20 family molecular chaperone IbpA
MSPFDWTSHALHNHVSQIERLFGAVHRPLGLISRPFIPVRRERQASVPAVNIYTDPSSVIVTCEVAGIPPEAIGVEVDGDVLTIQVRSPQTVHATHATTGAGVPDPTVAAGTSATSATSVAPAAGAATAADSTATRRITLPFPVANERAQARCRNGVLTITLTRPVDAGRRTVKVSVT